MKWRCLGDTLLWTSSLAALRHHFPDAEIDLALPFPYLSLFQNDPRFSKRFALQREWRKIFALAYQLRKRRYDLILNFHANERSAALALLAGGKKRIIHHHSRKTRRFFSDTKVVNLGIPMAARDRDLNVVRSLGWEGAIPKTEILISPEIIERGRLALVRDFPNSGERLPLVLFGPGASRPAKQWPLESYAKLAELLKGRARMGVLYESERLFAGKAYERQRLSQSALFLETPTLTSVMGYLSHAACYVGSDSGIKHLACALGISTLTLFGPESMGEWHFYDETHTALQRRVGCRFHDPDPPEFAWCGETICPLASHACMQSLEPEEVALKLARYL